MTIRMYNCPEIKNHNSVHQKVKLGVVLFGIQSNLAISDSANSELSLFRTKISHC